MLMPYVSVLRSKGVYHLVVDCRNKGKKQYPLDKQSAIKAGADLFKAGFDNWLCSSSLDNDFKVYYGIDDFDPSASMRDGYEAALEKSLAPRNSLYEKIRSYCNNAQFKKNLSAEEKKVFQKFLKEKNCAKSS